jgi:hypothetical protein
LSTTGISQASAVRVLVESARQRRFIVLAVEQLALALTLVSAGAILLLLLGTQILAWYWLLLLAAVGIGIAAYRIRARLASSYSVAQFLDRRLNLHDSLSTAWFLLSRPEGSEQPVDRYQLDYAEQIARGVDPVAAFPLTGQRVWAIAGGVAAVAFGLFALRYMVTDSLNLRNALLPMHQIADVVERVEKTLGMKPKPTPNADKGDQRTNAVPQTNDQEKTAQQDHPNAEEMKTSKVEGATPPNVPMAPTSSPQDSKNQQDAKSENQEGPASAGEKKSTEKGQMTPTGQQANDQKKAGSPQEGGKEQEAANPKNASQENSVGAMDKLKEAISSLMSKMRPNQGAQKQQQSQQQNDKSSEGQQAGAQAKADKDQNAEAQKNGSDQQSSEEKSADAQAQGQTTEKAQSAQGHSSDKSADKSNSEAHSGVGRQDGDKSIAEREQLKAMGKLAEITGKRSADLTGDVMIENPSGKQQLKTGYSQNVGTHADLGGEINRDEIPAADQQYVREYMEEVRKPAKAPSAK